MLIMSQEAKSDRPQVVDIGWRCMKAGTALQCNELFSRLAGESMPIERHRGAGH